MFDGCDVYYILFVVFSWVLNLIFIMNLCKVDHQKHNMVVAVTENESKLQQQQKQKRNENDNNNKISKTNQAMVSPARYGSFNILTPNIMYTLDFMLFAGLITFFRYL